MEDRYSNFVIMQGGWKLPNPELMLEGTIVYDSVSELEYIVKTKEPDLEKAAKAHRKERTHSILGLVMFLLAFAPAVFIGVFLIPQVINDRFDSAIEAWNVSFPFLITAVISLIIFITANIIFAQFEKRAHKLYKQYKKTFSYWSVYEQPEEEEPYDEDALIDGLPPA